MNPKTYSEIEYLVDDPVAVITIRQAHAGPGPGTGSDPMNPRKMLISTVVMTNNCSDNGGDDVRPWIR